MNDRDRDRDRDRVDRSNDVQGHHQHSGASTSGLRSVGDWSEHTSSSGKKYYYNCVTEVSQWEKPREWVEYERQRSSISSSNKMPIERRPQKLGGHRGLRTDPEYDLEMVESLRARREADMHEIPERQPDMEISSHETTPTSDESHPQQQRLYYDNSGDKTPPQAEAGTPSPTPLTPTQSENLTVGGLVSSSPLIALKPQIPALTPSLGRFYKEALIGHVTNWPAEAVEKTCHRINEEHLNISNLGITKVSTELKMARSLVRLAEIQATLQEQRILFLRQQSLDLESMRPRVAYLHSINSEELTTADIPISS